MLVWVFKIKVELFKSKQNLLVVKIQKKGLIFDDYPLLVTSTNKNLYLHEKINKVYIVLHYVWYFFLTGEVK